MNKNLIIVGVLALAGVGAYFYFKSKKEISGILQNTDTSISVPPTGTVITNPDEAVETAKKIADAKALASKVSILKKERNQLLNLNLERSGFGGVFKQNLKPKINALDKKINDIDTLIKSLGYMELDGNIVKIV